MAPADVTILILVFAVKPLANLSLNSGVGPLTSNVLVPTVGLSEASLLILHVAVANVCGFIVKYSGGSF